MNRLKNISLLISFMLILFSCSDEVQLKKSDLKKYTWLTPFTLEYNKMKFNGYHNIDLGTIEFSYEISLKKYTDVFMQFDSIAAIEKWKILKMSEVKRRYSKHISQNIKDGGYVIMTVEIDTIQNRLLFKIE